VSQVFVFADEAGDLVFKRSAGVSRYFILATACVSSMCHWQCGRHSKIVRMPLAGPGEVIATLSDGKDALTAFTFDETDGSTTQYFDRVDCNSVQSGIYRIPDADTAAP
jgi:hypothetical protein